MRWLLLTLLLLIPSLADAACTGSSPTFNCSCEVADLRALFNTDSPSAVHEGDTINVAAGTCVWNSQLVIGEPTLNSFKAVPGFSLVGAGEGTTIFQRGPSYAETSFGGMLVVEMLAASGLTTITGFTMDMQGATTPSNGSLVVMGSGLDKFRVHHVTITNLRSFGFVSHGNRAAAGALEFSGLFDHDTCITGAVGAPVCWLIKGTWNGGAASGNQNPFTFAPSFGSNHTIYIEDSTCTYNVNNFCFDSYFGGSVVIRKNTSTAPVEFHGADSGLRGNRQAEIYRNTFSAPVGARAAVNLRGGSPLMFENSYASGYTAAVFTLQRPVDASMNVTPRFLCGSSSAWDGNLGTGSVPTSGVPSDGNQGWPCLDQPGWFFTGVGPNGSAAIYEPSYFWNNSLNSAAITYTKNDAATSQATRYITADRDYYFGGIVAQTSSSSPFDGTTGVGFGTLARRPATCTTGSYTTNGGVGGVGYFAIDQGSWNTSGDGLGSGLFYKCTATNTWTLAYTPYAYPHPLQGSAPAIPSAPTGLRTLGTSTGTTCTVTWAEAGLSGLLGYHLYRGTATGNYSAFPVINKTAALSLAAHQPPRQHTFQFPVAGTYYISVTAYSADVSDTAAATEVTCTSTGLSRTASTNRSAH